MAVCVCSAGGAGTTMLQSVFDVGIYGRYKHAVAPPKFDGVPPRVIFVYTDIAITLQYLFARFGYSLVYLDRNGHNPHRHREICQYLADGDDDLKIREQWDNWQRIWPPYPILFVDYRHMWENKEFISDWAGEAQAVWPKYRERKTVDTLSPKQMEQLRDGYGRMMSEMKSMPTSFGVNGIWEKATAKVGSKEMLRNQREIRDSIEDLTRRIREKQSGLRGQGIQHI